MDPETEALVERVASKAAEEAVRDMLLMMGFDIEDPHEMQADMQSIRQWRHSTTQIKNMALKVVIGTFFTGLLALLWLGFKEKVTQWLM